MHAERTAVLAALAVIAFPAGAQSPSAKSTTGFLSRTLEDDRGMHRYVVFVPPQYDAARSWPTIVFLNGAGECGTDGFAQVSVGLGPAIMAHIERWPFLVVFPQKPDRASAWEDHDAMVMAMLESVRKDYRVDDRRLFLTGLSQGGHGTWVLGAGHKDLWNAIAPVCGYADATAIAGDLAAMPIWCFHGEDDKAVSVQQSKDITAAIAAKGGAPRLSLYPGVGHDSWVRAYRDEPVAAWLLMARKEPVLAHYLTDPSAITKVDIKVASGSWEIGEGGETAAIALDGDAARWSFLRSRGFESSLRPEPEKKGELEGNDARRFVSARLAMLAVDGGFDAEQTLVAGRQEAQRTNAWSIDIALDGSHGAWSYRHDSPTKEGTTAADNLLTAMRGLAR